MFLQAVRLIWLEKERLMAVNATEVRHREEALLAKRARVYDLYEDGTYGKTAFTERLDKVNLALAQLQTIPTDPLLRTVSLAKIEESVFAFADDFDRMMNAAAAFTTSRFRRFVFPKGIAFDPREGYRTTSLPKLLAMKSTFGSSLEGNVNLLRLNANQIFTELEELVRLNEGVRVMLIMLLSLPQHPNVPTSPKSLFACRPMRKQTGWCLTVRVTPDHPRG